MVVHPEFVPIVEWRTAMLLVSCCGLEVAVEVATYLLFTIKELKGCGKTCFLAAYHFTMICSIN